MITPDEYSLEISKAVAEAAGKESVNKLSLAIGGLFPFWGLKKKAIDTYIKEIEKSNIPPEVKMMSIANARKTYKQLSNQLSIAQIAQLSAHPKTDFSEGSLVDDEWLERFMDSAKFVSDEKVQWIWGNILAKEFENPNSTPPSIIRILSEITPQYAKIFESVCHLNVKISLIDQNDITLDSMEQVIIPHDYDYLHTYGITFSSLNELQLLGLIQYEGMGIGIVLENEKITKLSIQYGRHTATIKKYPDKHFPIGSVRLTDAGEVIAKFIGEQEIASHFKEVVKYLKSNDVVFDLPY